MAITRRVYEDFDDELLLRLANRTDITDRQRGHFLNDAYQAIINEFRHPEMEAYESSTLATGLSSMSPGVSVPILWPIAVKDVDRGKLLDYTSLDDVEKGEITDGIPSKYYWYGTVLYFDRAASEDINLKVWFKTTVTYWSEAGTVLNEVYDPLIPMLAAKFAYEAIGNQQAAHIQETEYNNRVARIREPAVEHEKNDRRQGIKVRLR